MMTSRLLAFVFCCSTFAAKLPAQTNFLAETTAEKNSRMAWWREARFGMFIHWGLYAVPAGAWNGHDSYGEWIMEEAKIPIPEYEKLTTRFNPVQFDAEKWASMAKNAGMKYIVITSKHHDGFCLWDSKTSDYDVADRTPFRRDILRELADACRKHGLKMCFYHSIMDWHHPDARGSNFEKYRENYLKPQLRELVQGYGPLGVLWFDGEWIDEWTEPQGRELYQFVRSLQPNIIINNRVGKGRNGMQGMSKGEAAGDFGTPEQEILGTASTLDWESCMTMNGHWGYCRADKNFKTAHELIWNLVDCAAKGGNYLLNIGPTAEGLFPPESVNALEKMGQWMAVNSEAIYGSRAWTHFAEGENARFTAAPDGRSVHVFLKKGSWQTLPGSTASRIFLKKIMPRVGSEIRLLGRPEPLNWHRTTEGVEIFLPETPADEAIFVLKIEGQPAVLAAPPVIADGKKTRVFAKKTTVEIRPGAPGQIIRFTTDGSEPTEKSKRYTKPLAVSKSRTIKARAFENGKTSSETVVFRLVRAECGIELGAEPASQYAADGAQTLLDGEHGMIDFQKGNWLGFSGKDAVATLDFGKKRPISSLTAHFLRRQSAWIFLPTAIEWEASDDGKNWRPLAAKRLGDPTDGSPDQNWHLELRPEKKTEARFVRLTARSVGRCPAWHAGAGGEAWVFLDEIEVR